MEKVSNLETVKDRTYYTYRCQVCGFENIKTKIPNTLITARSVTKLGSYGDNAAPTPVTFADEMYAATTISFSSAPKLSDSAYLFADKHFSPGMTIRVATTSGTNNGDYTISDRGVNRGEILVKESLTDETAAAAGTVTISRIIYKPNITTGCPFCGSLNSR